MDATLFPSSVVVRRSRFEEVGGFLEEVWLGEDQLLWYHLCVKQNWKRLSELICEKKLKP